MLLAAMSTHISNARVQVSVCPSSRVMLARIPLAPIFSCTAVAPLNSITCCSPDLPDWLAGAVCDVRSCLQEKACGALWNLQSNSDTNKRLIAARNGIQLTLAAMRVHLASSGIQVKGCGTLWSLAYGCKEHQDIVAGHGRIAVPCRCVRPRYSCALSCFG